MNNKDLISQYVDTGLKLPEYQVMKLSNQDRKTYMRKRIIASGKGEKENESLLLNDYELSLLDKFTLSDYIFNRTKKGNSLQNFELKYLDDNAKSYYAKSRAVRGYQLSDDLFMLLSDEMKKNYLNKRLERSNPISSLMLQYGGDDFTETYINKQVKMEFRNSKTFGVSFYKSHGVNRDEYPYWFHILKFEQKIKAYDAIIDYIIDNGFSFKYIQIEDEYYNHLSQKRKHYLKYKIDNNDHLSYNEFNDLTKEEKIIYVNKMKDIGEYIYSWEKPYITK